MDVVAISDDELEESNMICDDLSLLEEDEPLPDYLWAQDEDVPGDNELITEYAVQTIHSEDPCDEISDSSENDSSCQSEVHPDQRDQIKKNTRRLNKVNIFRFRKKLNQLDSMQKEKELIIEKFREELTACRQRIEVLEQQKSAAEMDIQTEQENNNTAALFRLRALHKRLCADLVNEQDVESQVAVILQENECDLWHIEVEQGKFTSLREKLQQDEEELERQRKDLADQRIQKEKGFQIVAEHKRQKEKLQEIRTLKEREQRYRKAMEDAQRNHEKAVQFLKETMTRVREKETEKEMKSREEMEKRMQAVLTLKNNISANRENLRVIEARNKAKATMMKKQDMLEKDNVLSRGEDATKFMIHQRRLQEFEIKKQEFEEKQRIRKQEIISRLLQEEANQGKKLSSSIRENNKQKQSKLRSKTIHYIESVIPADQENEPEITKSKKWRSVSSLSSDEDDSTTGQQSPSVVPEKAYHTEEVDSETFAQPEFMGLWNEDHKPYKVPKEETEVKPLWGSNMEIMAETRSKIQNGTTQKQAVSGHEYKGCPFYYKPNVIHFKDLEVGKVYKKKVTLTNASYTINFCKLVDVSPHLKDFISIQFDPPGQLSAGMSCEVTVTFTPMVNEDLEGEVMFLAKTGAFSIPVKCTTKKCELSVEKERMDFGTQVVGETITQIITLTNRGALGTRFSIRTITQDNGAHTAVQEMPSEASPRLDDSVSKDKDTDLRAESGNHDEIEKPKSRQTKSVCESTSPRSIDTQEARSVEVETSVGIERVSKEHSTLHEDSLNEVEQPQVESEEELIEIKLGEVTGGEIGPFTSVKIPIIFAPTFPGTAHALFEVSFDDPNSKQISVTAIGTAVDVPVYVSNSNIDLKICTYDRLYQDSIVVKNRATTALRLKFEVCKELKNHMELLPKTGFIQAQSSFSVQLKFIPRLSLLQDAGAYFDKETGVLEAPMTISVADQTRPIHFTVSAVITTSDLEISPAVVDFGYCTIYEAVRSSIQLTNKSILPQEYGFVGIPEYVEIQPADGFGTLLPLETVTLDVIFRAAKAKEYAFELTCKSAINRQFRISCKAVGVHPPLELSHSLIQFPATALNDISTATLYVINSHTSRNEFTHPVPRIGGGDIAPVGPTSFEIHVPDDVPVTVSPSVGTVLPGERCLIQVSYRPTLSDREIREEALRLLSKANEAKALLEKKTTVSTESEVQGKREKRDLSANKERRKQASSTKREKKQLPSPKQKEKTPKAPETVPPELPGIQDIKVNSDEYVAAQTSVYRRFAGTLEKYIIPCFIASCDISKRKDQELNFSPYNTLFLELHCPAITPPLLVTSDNGRHHVDFGEVATGQRVVRRVTLQNISLEPLELGFSIFNPCGPFVLLNIVKTVEPGASCFLLIAFSPCENKTFFETLEVRSPRATLTLGLKGKGIAPSVSCSLDGGIMDMGYVLSKDSVTSTFQLQNTSTVPVNYSVNLGSLSVNRYSELQKLPRFLSCQKKSSDLVGTQNYNGLSVFGVCPVEGTIDPEKSHEITVTFSPDHESVHYSDSLTVELYGKHTVHTIQLKGASRDHIMYVEGGDPMDVPVESLGIIPEYEGDEQTKTLLLTFRCIQTEADLKPAVRDLRVGCIRTTALATKKGGEFFWDNVQLLQQKGFTIEPVKSAVDAGQHKTVSLRWVPPAGYDPSKPGTTMAKLTLKGDITESYQVILATQVVSV
ncbi:cilia- and flagella-associated protein 74 [Spea bombifrons]|uniref:cilia- and flagella-associated protein 74 n=1 Tax=Spea bombifrons TaxID=233779 RepID=UPI00234B84FF|nr:cilia- and flagella-associated protein 74 [Spea bombifrons]